MDWLAIDSGAEKRVGRVDFHIYDDGGGVQAPASYSIQSWSGGDWKDIDGVVREPPIPTGGIINSASFNPVTTSRIRVVFRASQARRAIEAERD